MVAKSKMKLSGVSVFENTRKNSKLNLVLALVPVLKSKALFCLLSGKRRFTCYRRLTMPRPAKRTQILGEKGKLRNALNFNLVSLHQAYLPFIFTKA